MKFLKHSRCLIAAMLGLSVLLGSGCGKKDDASTPSRPKEVPEAMISEPETIKNVISVYSIRHPKLILEDFKHFTNAIPEAGIASFYLISQLTEYGYPHFKEIKENTNIGLVIPNMYSEADAEWVGRAPLVIMAQLTGKGPLYRYLTEEMEWLAKEEGEWTLFARKAEDFNNINDMEGIVRYVSKPQTEELRCYASVNSNLLKGIRNNIREAIDGMQEGSHALPKETMRAYAEIAMTLLDQLHSGDASLDLTDKGIVLNSGLQFEPSSRLGTLARYRADQDVEVAKYVPYEGMLVTHVARFSPQATAEGMQYLTELIASVDYPQVADPAKRFNEVQQPWCASSDGTAAVAYDFSDFSRLIEGDTAGFRCFGVYSGNFTPEQVSSYIKATVDWSNSLVRVIADIRGSEDSPLPLIYEYAKDALNLDGISFDSMKAVGTGDGGMSSYYGVVNSNMVMGDSVDTLNHYIPSLKTGNPVQNSLAAIHSLSPYQVSDLKIHGGKIMDLIVSSENLNTSNPDIVAGLDEYRSAYAECPILIAMEIRQARAGMSIEVPYVFIGNTVKLYTYIKMAKRMR